MLWDGQSPGAVAKELELVEQTLRNWATLADAGTMTGVGAGSKPVTPEQMELSRLCVVASQILEHGFEATQRLLGVHHPVVVVEPWLEARPVGTRRPALAAGLLREAGDKLAPEDARERAHREQESLLRPNPLAA